MEIEIAKLIVAIAGFFVTTCGVVFAAWLNVSVRLKTLEVEHKNTNGRIKSLSDRTEHRFERYGSKIDKLCGEIHSLVVQLAQYEGRRAREERVKDDVGRD